MVAKDDLFIGVAARRSGASRKAPNCWWGTRRKLGKLSTNGRARADEIPRD
jgi:hypothetical protein